MRQKSVQVDIFVAKDGTEFDSAEKCAEYEEFLDREEEYEKAKAHVAKLEVFYGANDTPEVIPLSVFAANGGNIVDVKRTMRKEFCGHKAYRFFRLENRADAEALAVMIAHDNTAPEKVLRASGKTRFPCVAVYSPDYKWGREIATFENQVELIRKYLKLHGYSMERQSPAT